MADSLTIDQLAKQFFVSKYHLMHEFSQKTGTSVYRYLMQQWLHAVCELLEQGTVPNEAYLLCGFKDLCKLLQSVPRRIRAEPPGICSDPPDSGGRTHGPRCIEKSPQRFLTALSEL